MDFIRRMSDKGKNGTGTERIRTAESNRNFLISNPVLKKLISRFLVLGTAFSLLLGCTSCIRSNYPLSDSNNCHEKKLEGTWIMKKREDGKTQTYTIEIYDTGSKYNIKFIENNKAAVTHFILTKLESYYFVSLFNKHKDGDSWWEIYRVQVDDNKLLVFTLNEKGSKLAKEIKRRSDGRVYITQRELQQWCVQNANLFSEKIYCYERVKGMPANTRVAPITKNAEDLSKVTVKAKDGVR